MAFQLPHWQDFYEKAWAFRAKFLEEQLESGANALQAIKELEKKERGYTLGVNNTTGEVSYMKKEISDDEPHIKDTNIALYSKRGFNGNIIILPKHTSYNFRTLLIDLIDATGPYDAIIELGCGYGRNLFEIFYGGGPREAKYIGGEFTKSGVEIAQKLAKKAPKMKTEFFHFNHLEPKLPFKKPFKRAFVFTCHSIEQVMQINENWFDEVVKAGEFVRGAHIEPFGFQLKNSGPLSDMHKDFMIQNSWNINFAEVLRQALERKIIKDEQIFLEMGVTPDVNVGSLAFWSKA
ncbi:class I SAM-dependent methyltransferase [Campylobacter sp. 50012-21]|uniref:class I SAM-dependent methyltransferase n=1 Tax=Campylobacter magnus TaxID=3026462 RepID=UPI002361390A|nr:class I SAM-dependent methyltransferase [Campylobacter magnus]MDD0845547.1 class I SAM-dependent methyltransferase [Campylobacter magnus]